MKLCSSELAARFAASCEALVGRPTPLKSKKIYAKLWGTVAETDTGGGEIAKVMRPDGMEGAIPAGRMAFTVLQRETLECTFAQSFS